MRKLFALLLLFSIGIAGAFTFKDDFASYKEGSDASPVWTTSSINWRVEKGAIINDDVGRSVLVLEKSPYGRELTFSAKLIVRQKRVADWKVAGITVYLDSGHFWHLALVEAPENMGGRHFAELAQMLNGEWNSQGKLRMTTDGGFDNFNWQYNHPYKLEIRLSGDGIEGLIYDSDGRLLARRAYAFDDNPAVKFGKVGLTNSGFLTIFDDVEVDILKEEKYSPPKPVYPPYKGRGWSGIKAKATGFFYTKEINGVWWLIDPLGNAFYSVGTDHCNYYVHWAEKLGYAPYNRFVSEKYGSEDKWGDSAAERLRIWGFTSLGTNSSQGVRYKGLPHTEFAGLGSGFAHLDYITQPINWTGFPNVFSPKFEEYCMKQARERCAPHKDDPWLIGYFIDNELEWFGKGGREWGLVDDIFKLPPGNSAKTALIKFLRGKYKNDVQAFNKAWGVKISSFGEIDFMKEPLQTTTEQGIKDKMEFVGIIADRYFQITTKAIRAADPNHLVLGCRFAWDAPEPAWISAGKYCDIVSVNMYPWVDLEKEEVRDVEEMLRKRYELARKPFMLTEWSFPALDSGLPCTHGAGQRFATQKERAKAFSIFQNLLFRLPFMVGSHYFMWVDEPKEGISKSFPENTNYGLVNEKDEPYAWLVLTAVQVNYLVYAIHSGQTPHPVIDIGEGIITIENKGTPGKVESGTGKDKLKNGSNSIPPYKVRFDKIPDEILALRISVNGKEETKTLPLTKQAKVEKVEYDLPSLPGAYLVDVKVYWKNGGVFYWDGIKVAQARKSFYVKGSEWAEGNKRVPLMVINEGESTVKNLPLTISLQNFPLKLGEGEEIAVYDGSGRLIPAQFDRSLNELTITIGEMAPKSALLLFLYPTYSKVSEEGEKVKVSQSGNKFEVDNGVLRLVKDEDDGDLLDAVYINGVKLGRYQALIREDLTQQLWVAPNKLEKVEIKRSGEKVIVDIIARFDGEKAITEVGEGGEFAHQRVTPLEFRTAYRIIIYPDVPWLIGKFLWVENTSSQVFPLGAYFHYLPSEIGGDAKDDEPDGTPRRWCYIHEKEEVVPSYYDALPGASWFDKGVSAWYGAMPLSGEEFHFIFWKDEGGGEHPDIWKEVKRNLAPKEILKDSRGEVLIFGAMGEKGYEEIANEVRGWQDVKWEFGKPESR